MIDSKCKICRRAGTKLFLKGDKCLSPKCPMVRKPYAPGKKGKKRPRPLSEYGKELREKQKLKNWYNLQERQFRNYVRAALEARRKVEDTAALLIELLESRLDNVVFRLGFANSRAKSRQLVTHGHFWVNDKPIDVPSYKVKIGDKISLKPASAKKNAFKSLTAALKKYAPPSWLKLDAEKLEGKVQKLPTLEESAPPAEIASVFEFYSK